MPSTLLLLPAFGSSSWALWSFGIFLSRIFLNWICMQLFLVLYSFFIFHFVETYVQVQVLQQRVPGPSMSHQLKSNIPETKAYRAFQRSRLEWDNRKPAWLHWHCNRRWVIGSGKVPLENGYVHEGNHDYMLTTVNAAKVWSKCIELKHISRKHPNKHISGRDWFKNTH